MRVYCYHSHVPLLSIEDETRLIMLWKAAWSKAGFEPIVLNEFIARKNPLFEHLQGRLLRGELPSVNPKNYDEACFFRYIAMAEVGGGIMSDYDVIPYGWTYAGSKMTRMLRTYQGGCPSLVTGAKQAYLAAVKAFLEYQVGPDDRYQGKPHISDMYILQKGLIPHTPINEVKDYGENGWEKATAVHYNTSSLTKNKLLPRWKHIPTLRPI